MLGHKNCCEIEKYAQQQTASSSEDDKILMILQLNPFSQKMNPWSFIGMMIPSRLSEDKIF